MELGITGKIALVIGGSRGNGKAVAQELARNGCRVIVLARDKDRLDRAVAQIRAEGGEAFALTGDGTEKAGIAKLFAAARANWGAPDILVYNNSGPPNHSFQESDDEDFYEAYKRVIMGFTWCVREAMPDMKARNWGRIVTLGSICVKEMHQQLPLVLHNSLRPAGVGLSKTLANDLGRWNITVNTIGIGTIEGEEGTTFHTNYNALAAREGITYEEAVRRRVEGSAIKRAGRPDEVGSLCAFLCSERAAYITGQTILLDGGRVQSLL
jgi:3-oxoacyl-[acyl-carrier protein] reductase